MAIEDYTGITKIHDYLYEVTAEVNLDASATLTGVNAGETFAIGDMDNCTFIMKDGGFLRFVSGDSATAPYTTFKDCTFIETSTAKEIVGDTYYRGPHYETSPGVYDTIPNASRWYAPGYFTFEGCTFIVDTQTTFDITGASHYYNWLKTPEGKRCRMFADASVHPSSMTENMYWTNASTITGLFMDVSSRAMLNPDETGNKSNILIADKDPGNFATGNFAAQISTWDPQYGYSHKFYRGIQARAVITPQHPYYEWWFTASAGQTNFSGTADSSAGTNLTLAIPSSIVNGALTVLHGTYGGSGSNTITDPDWDRIDPTTGFYIDDLVYDSGAWKSERRLWVYKNDVLLEKTTDYTFWEGAVTLTSGAAAGDEIHIKLEDRFRPDLRTVNLVDPVGRTVKEQNPDYDYNIGGTLKLWRTLSGSFVDISTKAAITECRTVVRRDSTSKLELDTTAASFSVELNYTEELMQFNNIVEDGDYTVKFLAYGYDLQTRGITVEDTNDPDGYDQGSILLFQDPYITERTRATVDAYTALVNPAEMYDYINSYEMDVDVADFGTEIVTTADGEVLDFGAYNVYFGTEYPNVMEIFDSSYTTPGGYSPGDTIFSGYTDEAATAVGNDGTVTVTADLTEFPGWNARGYSAMILKDIQFNNDGTGAWILWSHRFDATASSWITQLSLSTAYDVTTATKDATYQLAANIRGDSVFMNVHPDGDKIYLFKITDGNYNTITLNTAWDLSAGFTVGTSSTNTNISNYADRVYGTLNHDGTKFYSVKQQSINLLVRTYPLSTAYDFSTIGAYTDTDYVISGMSNANGSFYSKTPTLTWSSDGETLFIGSPASTGGKYAIYQNLTTPGGLPTTAEQNVRIEHTLPSQTASLGKITIAPNMQNIVTTEELYFTSSVGTATITMDSYLMSLSYALAGAPDSIFIKSGDIQPISDWTTLKTTGYFYEQGDAAINMQYQDATGIGTTVTIKGINPNTEVRMYRVSDDVEIAGIENSVGTEATLAYNFVVPTDMYIVIHNVGYITSPRYIEFTTQAAAATLTVFQSIDRTYRNP